MNLKKYFIYLYFLTFSLFLFGCDEISDSSSNNIDEIVTENNENNLDIESDNSNNENLDLNLVDKGPLINKEIMVDGKFLVIDFCYVDPADNSKIIIEGHLNSYNSDINWNPGNMILFNNEYISEVSSPEIILESNNIYIKENVGNLHYIDFNANNAKTIYYPLYKVELPVYNNFSEFEKPSGEVVIDNKAIKIEYLGCYYNSPIYKDFISIFLVSNKSNKDFYIDLDNEFKDIKDRNVDGVSNSQVVGPNQKAVFYILHYNSEMKNYQNDTNYANLEMIFHPFFKVYLENDKANSIMDIPYYYQLIPIDSFNVVNFDEELYDKLNYLKEVKNSQNSKIDRLNKEDEQKYVYNPLKKQFTNSSAESDIFSESFNVNFGDLERAKKGNPEKDLLYEAKDVFYNNDITLKANSVKTDKTGDIFDKVTINYTAENLSKEDDLSIKPMGYIFNDKYFAYSFEGETAVGKEDSIDFEFKEDFPELVYLGLYGSDIAYLTLECLKVNNDYLYSYDMDNKLYINSDTIYFEPVGREIFYKNGVSVEYLGCYNDTYTEGYVDVYKVENNSGDNICIDSNSFYISNKESVGTPVKGFILPNECATSYYVRYTKDNIKDTSNPIQTNFKIWMFCSYDEALKVSNDNFRTFEMYFEFKHKLNLKNNGVKPEEEKPVEKFDIIKELCNSLDINKDEANIINNVFLEMGLDNISNISDCFTDDNTFQFNIETSLSAIYSVYGENNKVDVVRKNNSSGDIVYLSVLE